MSTWWAGVGCLRLSAGRLPVISFLITEPILGWSEAPLHQPLGAALGAPPRAVLAPIIPPGLSPPPPPTEPAADFPPVLGVGSLLLGSHSTQVGFHDRVSPCAGASGREGGRAASCPRMQGSPVAPWGGPSGNRVRGWQAALGVSCLVLSCWQDDLLSLTGTR